MCFEGTVVHKIEDFNSENFASEASYYYVLQMAANLHSVFIFVCLFVGRIGELSRDLGRWNCLHIEGLTDRTTSALLHLNSAD